MTLLWISWAASLAVIWTGLIWTGSVDTNIHWLNLLLAFTTVDYHRLYRYRSALPGSCLLLDMYSFYSAPP